MLFCLYVGLAIVPLAGLVSHMGYTAVRFSGSSIAHTYSMSKDPTGVMQVLQTVWEAALQGKSERVQSLLRKVNLPVDSVHHISKTKLVLDIAGTHVSTEEQDAQLAEVLRVLHCMSWNLAVKDSRRQQNALHVLVQQHKSYNVLQRVTFLIESAMADPEHNNMLSDVDWVGKSPQQRVAHSRWSLVAMLRSRRLMVEQAADEGGIPNTGDATGALSACHMGDPSSHALDRAVCAAPARSA